MIYLLYGEEKYDLYKFVDKIKSKFDKLETGVNLFYITKENMNEIESISQSVTFFGSNKIIIIKDTNLKFDVKKLILNCEKKFIKTRKNLILKETMFILNEILFK